jgi:hypothetical protein
MREENIDMDKKLRQQEEQSLPDLSHQEAHWKKMQGLIDQNPPTRKSIGERKPWIWLVAAISLLLLVWMGNRLFITKKPGAETVKADAAMNVTDTSGRDTIKLYNRQLEVIPDSQKLTALTKVRVKDSLIFIKPLMQRQTIPTAQRLNGVKPVSTPKALRVKNGNLNTIDPAPVTPSRQTDSLPPQKGMTLDEFFSQLRKPEQHFSINNQRDTLLNGIEGTALFIPAGTFDSKERVQLTLTEYYSYADIITHQLSTCSNGAPLVTGGMIHLTASAKGQELNIRPSKAIRWFVPDTAASLSQMQLFNGVTNTNQTRRQLLNEERDTMVFQNNQGLVNWLPNEMAFTNTYFTTLVRVLDLRNEPYKSRSTRRGIIGKFYIDPNSNLNRAEISQQMKERFGYQGVVVRKQREGRGLLYKLTPGFLRRKKERPYSQPLGDSAWIDPAIARAYRLTPTDTLISRNTSVGMSYQGIRMASPVKGFDTLLSNSNLNNLAKRYSVDIRELGWINCDRFFRDNSPRIDYIVNLSDTAKNYFTLLVFDDLKSMINGTVSGNRVLFSGMPLGKKARLISVGIRDGKPISVMEPVTISRQVLEGLKFEETSAPAFKEEVSTLDR